MADLKFACPECQQHILVDDSAAGERIDCPYCQTGCLIPNKSTDPVAIVERRAPKPAAKLKFACPECHQRILVDDSGAGLWIDCPRCQAGLRIPRNATDTVEIIQRRLAKSAADPAGDEALQKEIALLKAIGAKRETELAGLRKELEEVRKNLEKLEAVSKERDELKAGAVVHQIEIARHRNEVQEIAGRFEAQERKFKEVVASFAKSERDRIELEHQLREPIVSPELGPLREKCDQVQKQLGSAQATLLAMRDDRDAARKEVIELRQRGAQVLPDVEKIRADGEAAARELTEAKARIAVFGRDLEAKSYAANQAEERLGEVSREREYTRRALEKVEGEREKLARRTAELIEELKQAQGVGMGVAGMEARAIEAEKRAQEREAELNAARTDLEALRQAETTSQKRVEVLEAELSRGGDDLGRLRAELETARGEHGRIEAGFADKERGWSEAKVRLEAELTELRKRAEESEKKAESLASELIVARSEAAGATGEKTASIEKLSALQTEVGELTAQLGAVMATEKKSGERIQELERELTAEQERGKKSDIECDLLRTELAAVAATRSATSEDAGKASSIDQEKGRDAIAEMQERMEVALGKVSGIERERDQLREEVAGTREGLARAKEHLAMMQTRRDSMREEIARMKMQLGLAPDAVA